MFRKLHPLCHLYSDKWCLDLQGITLDNTHLIFIKWIKLHVIIPCFMTTRDYSIVVLYMFVCTYCVDRICNRDLLCFTICFGDAYCPVFHFFFFFKLFHCPQPKEKIKNIWAQRGKIQGLLHIYVLTRPPFITATSTQLMPFFKTFQCMSWEYLIYKLISGPSLENIAFIFNIQ